MSVLQQFKVECEAALRAALESTFPDKAKQIPRLVVPPSLEFGELSSSIAHEIARERKLEPREVAETIRASLPAKLSLVAGVESIGGYLNFKLNYTIAGREILGAVFHEGLRYGIEVTERPARVVVEHTSANPSGPLTMATARNSILGDVLARLIKYRGHAVNRRFYIDDMGRQVSILAYGYKLIHEPLPQGKPDHWLGRLYACVNCAIQLETTKKRLKQAEAGSEAYLELQRNLDEWVGIAAELETSDSDLLKRVLDSVRAEPDPEKAVQELGRLYEKKDKETVALVRKVVELCIGGVKSTLAEMEIAFDTWDWESEVLWAGLVKKTVEELAKLPFTRSEAGSLSLDVNAIVEAYSLRREFNLSENYEIPPLTLIRSDGTTLYATRDIAYSMRKFEDSDRVVNVIASEQALPQLQIRLALYALGKQREARNLIHYSYGLVELPGEKMSKRRARYIALDDVISQAKGRVEQTMAARKDELGTLQSNETIRNIALGAIRFTMLNINSAKNMTFTWDRVLSLERNSAPFINYAYTRAVSIIRKFGELPATADFSQLTNPLERLLIFKIGRMPDVFCEAADQLKPEELAGFANSLAEKFHEYYEKVDVIHSDEQVKNARVLLIKAIQIVLQNSMGLLGISLSERM